MTKRPPLKFLEMTKNRHGRVTIYFRRGKGPRARLPDNVDAPEFRIAYDAAFRGEPNPHVRDMPQTITSSRKQRTELSMRQAVRNARTRSRMKGLDFNLTLGWALDQAEAQEFRCALTGIEFYAAHGSLGSRNPYVPSLDRIDPKKGYTPDNVRIIVNALNTMLNDWGEPIFKQVANSYRYWQSTKAARSIPAPSMQNPAPNKFGS